MHLRFDEEAFTFERQYSMNNQIPIVRKHAVSFDNPIYSKAHQILKQHI
jgi:hypothetical protein